MPVEFLTSKQQAQYGQFSQDPNAEQLATYFWFDDQDRAIIFRHREGHNRLGFAIQLGTVRFLGTFLSDPISIPEAVIQYVADQLQLDRQNLHRYRTSETYWDHANEIRQRYGYHPFTDQPGHWRLVRWLYTRAWLSAERPSVLFDLATARCVEQKVLLPGVTTLARLVSQVRDRVSARLWQKLSRLPTVPQRQALESLLQVDPKTGQTALDRLRHPPKRISAPAIVKALRRLEDIRALGAQDWDVTGIPQGRLQALARYAVAARAQAIMRMREDRRMATLVAFAKTFTIQAQDDVLDLLDRYWTDLARQTHRREQQSRLRTLRDLDGAARQLREVGAMLLDDGMPDEDLKKMLFQKVTKEQLASAIQTVDTLTKPKDQTAAFAELFRHYASVRRFLPTLMATVTFEANPSGQPVLAAWMFIKSRGLTKKRVWKGAPTSSISASWRKVVMDDQQDRVNARAYTFWMLEQFMEALRRHDIYVPESERYGDPRAQLLQEPQWKAVRPKVLRSLNWSSKAEESLAPLAKELDDMYHQTAEDWPVNSAARLETFAGRERLVLSPLDPLGEPDSLQALRARVQTLLPHTDLPELLLEVNRWTGFAEAFTHFSEGQSRVQDLSVSVCAVLIARACNIGLSPVVQPGVPALERDRLTWVEQNYFRAETLTQANNALVAFHRQLPLAQTWGGGEVASADGLRFVTPVQTVHSGPNPKYFGVGRGVTYYNFTSDQFTGLHGLVIPGTLRDSLYLLELVLEQETVLQPREIMTDTAGYSDMIFGLFGLLGYQFSPHLADFGKSRLWRLDPNADYGVLNNISRHRIRQKPIVRHWDDMLRIAGSLKLGTVNATRLIRTLQRNGKPTMLGRAIGEFGRIFKTRHALMILNDEGYRRHIRTQLNRGESRHGLSRDVFYGKRGELHQHYREGQEDQLDALGFVVNAIVVWNTRYMALALDEMRQNGEPVHIEDVKRLSPLVHDHIHIMGHYSFTLPSEVERGQLRHLKERWK